MRSKYEQNYAGTSNVGRPMFFGGDIESVTSGMSPQELAFIQTKVATIDDIVAATGVPRALLGLTSTETFANADASIRVFLSETIKPVLDALSNTLDWRLLPPDQHLEAKDQTPEDTTQKMTSLKTAHEVGAITTNEKREMLGLDPVQDGDVIMKPQNYVPLDYMPTQPVPAGTTPSDTPSNDPNAKQKGFDHPLKDKVFRQMYAKLADKRLAKHEKTMTDRVVELFKEQESRLIESLSSTINKNLIDDSFSVRLETQLFKDGLLPTIRDIFKEAGQQTASTFQLSRFIYTDVMESELQRRAEMFSQSIISTTTDQLQRVFKESTDKEENRQQLVDRVKGLYNNISEGRAGVIARTEVHNAVQNANLATYKQAGLPIKIWVTVGDSNVRDAHKALDGQERPIDMPFDNGLMYPSEPNCRCSI